MSTQVKPISFARGAPSVDIIAVDDLRAAADAAWSRDPGGSFLYGTAVGYPPLREWLAEKHGVAVNNVMITNGSMQADAFLFELFVGNGDQVVIERPTYDRTLLNMGNRGAEFIEIELEDDGLDVEQLEQALQNGAKPRLAHVIPNFHNPAGCTLSLAKREKLVELAGEYKFKIFEDDPYREINFEGEKLPSMLELDGDRGNVIYVSSFTKTVCPGLRVGYVIADEQTTADLVKLATNTYIAPGMAAQSVVNEFCRSGKLDQSIATVSAALSERRTVLCDTLAAELPEATFVRPGGGYFLWVELPQQVDVAQVFDAAAERGVQIVKGTDFIRNGGDNCFRLAYSAVQTDEIVAGVKLLAEAVREQL